MKDAVVEVKSRAAWRRWLAKNHATSGPIWFVFHKNVDGKRPVTYEEAVEEALCFGWIDSTVRKRDERTYLQLFAKRRRGSRWSALNRARVRRMIEAGLMTKAGRDAIEFDDATPLPISPKDATMPVELDALLSKDRRAREFFESLPPSHRRAYMSWVGQAKKEETRQRRAAEAIRMLGEKQRLGMK